MTLRAPALVVAVAALAGCGYSLRGSLPDRIKTVAVPVFVNRTSEPAVENFLTQAVVHAFSTGDGGGFGRCAALRIAEE